MNIHFSELLLILFVALLVVKPERLPEVAFTLGRCVRWMQTMVAKVKGAIEQPMTNMGKYSYHEPVSSPIKNVTAEKETAKKETAEHE